MKRIVTLVLGAGLALAGAALRPSPAAANIFEDFGSGVCKAFGSCEPFDEDVVCRITQVRVTGTPVRHSYEFQRLCSDGSAVAAVSGAYEPGAGRASEKISSLAGPPWSLRSQWTCASDPWIYAGALPACSDAKVQTTGAAQGRDYESGATFPVSAGGLTDGDRRVLAVQLQNALAMTPAGSAAKPEPPADQRPAGLADGPTPGVMTPNGVQYRYPYVMTPSRDYALLDWCREWGTGCGKPAADRFCATVDDGRNPKAVSFHQFKRAVRFKPSVTIGSQQVCTNPDCNAFEEVTCDRPPDGFTEAPSLGQQTTAGARYPFPYIKTPQGDYALLDWCREWGKSCGQPAADAYCASMDKNSRLKAVSFKAFQRAGRFKPSMTIGSKQVCSAFNCTAFEFVVCGKK